MSKVYIKVDDQNRVIACDGGYSIENVDIGTWIFIDEGEGDRYNLCQGNYFDALRNEQGIPLYKWDGLKVVQRSEEEINADIATIPEPPKSLEQRVGELENLFSVLTYSLNEMSENVTVVEKVQDEDMPEGDYTNPIYIPDRVIMTEAGKWYYIDDKKLPHEAKYDAYVAREDFYSNVWFDFVE